MAYTMAADSTKLNELASYLDGLADTDIKGNIDNIYKDIEGFQKGEWSGEGYDTFVEGVGKYHDALDTLPAAIKTFSTSFRAIATETDALVPAVNDEIAKIV